LADGTETKSESRFEENLARVAVQMEKMRIGEYVALLQNTRRLFFVNFISGLARGVGMAIGFSILGAILIYLLTRLSVINLPIIGDFVAEIVRIVQTQLTR